MTSSIPHIIHLAAKGRNVSDISVTYSMKTNLELCVPFPESLLPIVKVWLRLRGSPLWKTELARVARVNVSKNVTVLMFCRLTIEASTRTTRQYLLPPSHSFPRAHYVSV